MFRRLLIANRGEIALRILRSCRALGVEAVVAHSEADRDAPWLDQADATVCLGPSRADRSYLNEDAVLQAAEQTACQALHPGYGFLSENARFAARCEQQGISFVGPSARSIRSMGDKAEAKRSMAAAGVPTIPGSDGPVADVEDAAELASNVGYPVLLKASAGGGGKGMRRCESEKDLARGFAEATLEATKAFGDATLYLEKFLEGGRHVEFQVLADAFGQAVHLGERECSIQRKHQKLIEESPSPAVDEAMRTSMGGTVAQAVARLGYRNAGTVEFLLAPDGQFYFMEMNTRLQVEHPVTEMLTGIDLVEAQLKIAANEPLPLRQPDIEFSGHAVEFRINAEDPSDGFRPDPGMIQSFSLGGTAYGDVQVRWDSAVRQGYRIPPHYDSMVGKLILHGPDRDTTLDAAGKALGGLKIAGVKTTIPVHLRLLEDQGFRSGRYDVNYLEASGLLQRI